MIQLKNCPFCGLPAGYITKNECLKNGHISYSIHHSVTGCVIDEFVCCTVFKSEEKAAEVWNSRRLNNE